MRSCVWWGQWLCNVAKVANKSQCTGYLPKTNKHCHDQLQIHSHKYKYKEVLVVMQCNGGGRSLCTGCSQGGGLGRSWRHHIPQQPHSPSPPSSSLPTFLNPSFPSWPSSVCCLLFVIDGVSPGGDTQATVNSATETVPSLVFWKPFALTSTHHAMTPRKL